MSMAAGSVSVANDGTVTGSGLALARYNARIAAPSMVAFLAMQTTDPLASNYVPAAAKITMMRGVAESATADAAADVAYITTNAAVSATASVTNQSLGALPETLTAGQPIAPPAAPVAVPVAGTIS